MILLDITIIKKICQLGFTLDKAFKVKVLLEFKLPSRTLLWQNPTPHALPYTKTLY
jgi:hypothetical protein